MLRERLGIELSPFRAVSHVSQSSHGWWHPQASAKLETIGEDFRKKDSSCHCSLQEPSGVCGFSSGQPGDVVSLKYWSEKPVRLHGFLIFLISIFSFSCQRRNRKTLNTEISKVQGKLQASGQPFHLADASPFLGTAGTSC